MKLLTLLCIPLASIVWADGTNTSTSTRNTVENVNAPTFVTPLSMGGGDVLPSYNTLTTTSATCASNQLIFDAVNTTTNLRGAGAPKIENHGYAVGARVVIPWGDDGRCEVRMELINRSAELEYARNTHNLCMGEGASFKAAGVFLDDDFFFNNESYRQCRDIFVLLKIAYKLQ